MATYRHAKGPSALQIIITVLIVVLSIAILAGAAFAVYHFAFDKEEPVETQPPTTPPTVATLDEAPTEAQTENPDLQYEVMAQDYLKGMSEDEKIYQMLMVTPEALTGVDVATVAGDTTKAAIEKYPVGGIIYDAQNFEDAEQTTELIKNSQSFAKTAMFIAVAEEGGKNSPVSSKLATTAFEDMSTYVKDGEQKIFDIASIIAKDISKFGFNLNLAPVANLEGDNSFGNDAATVSPFIAQAVNGYQSNNVISALKYFPVATDTDKAAAELTASEFLPFTAGIQNGVGAIVIDNVKVNPIDSENPAFMSERFISELLIKELKFSGVVMTQSLSDEAITSKYSTDEIVTGTINAGVNVLLAPNNIDEYTSSIKSALAEGKITQEQIDSSVTKILTLKFKFGILGTATSTTTSENASESATVGSSETATQ